MWTISDFLGLYTLSNCNIYISYVCSTSNFDVFLCLLRCSNKWCVMGHQQFLERDHTFILYKKQLDNIND